MRREEIDGVLVFGHHGRPVLVFPAQESNRYEWEERGMLAAVAGLVDAGRVKLYCVDSWDSSIWHDDWLSLEERAQRHGGYEAWLLEHVVPLIHTDCRGFQEILTTGVSFGAYHAANLTLRRADVFPLAICLSGIYDVAGLGWGERVEAVYFNNPADFVGGLHGDHLEWLRSQANLVLVVGRGAWEDSTGSLDQTHRFAALLA